MRVSTLLRMRLSPALREENFARNLVRRNINEPTEERPVPETIAKTLIFLAFTATLGGHFDKVEHTRMSHFRDKSALFRGQNPDPENNPSWGFPWKDYKYKISEW